MLSLLPGESMQGVASLLDDHYRGQVEDLWEELQQEFGIAGIYAQRFPHISFQVVESYAASRVRTLLRQLTQASAEFSVRTSGLGVFSGSRPVLYIPVVRSPQLDELHRRVWEILAGTNSGISEHYAPEMWIPHITLAEGDVDADKAAEIVRRWSGRNFGWEIRIHNLALLTSTDGKQEITFRLDFGPCE